MHAPIDVAWVFSLARSGSSITAYAAAAGSGAPVADEILGPWDRTEKPYNYPAEQAGLAEAFKTSGARLTPEIAAETRSLLERIAEVHGSTRVVSKHPHLRFTPEELAERFPQDKAVYVIRNPLRRLASIHARGWTEIVRPNHDLDFFREYAERWLRMPEQQRFVFENLKRDPRAYFAKIYAAWGWDAGEAELDRAVGYQRSTYHGRSGAVEEEHAPERAVSEGLKNVPEEAVDLYLADPFMQTLFKRVGWSRRASSYRPTRLDRLRAKLGSSGA